MKGTRRRLPPAHFRKGARVDDILTSSCYLSRKVLVGQPAGALRSPPA